MLFPGRGNPAFYKQKAPEAGKSYETVDWNTIFWVKYMKKSLKSNFWVEEGSVSVVDKNLYMKTHNSEHFSHQ